MNISVLFFGQIADIAGNDNLDISNVDTSNELKSRLCELYPALNEITYSVAVNKEIVQTNTALKDGDTVALLPPFSGG
ncbi:MAG: MoaD/ThiS family protein [Ignavibacteria bacterium]|jgi:molybdopterin synthase sulfur carrier subunit